MERRRIYDRPARLVINSSFYSCDLVVSPFKAKRILLSVKKHHEKLLGDYSSTYKRFKEFGITYTLEYVDHNTRYNEVKAVRDKRNK